MTFNMNIYLRYFDRETLVHDFDDALAFLRSIPDIEIDGYLENDLKQFLESNVLYPKRYKVKSRAYFIVIKTVAETLEQFKEVGSSSRDVSVMRQVERKERQDLFLQIREGWYDVRLNFKRVVLIEEFKKCQYCDTDFHAQVWASCIQECYDKVVAHLRSRADVDDRSQFPSIKGKKFECVYIGEQLV